jgi:hypothetical protein
MYLFFFLFGNVSPREPGTRVWAQGKREYHASGLAWHCSHVWASRYLFPPSRYYLKEPFGGRGRQKFYRFLLIECPPAGVRAALGVPSSALLSMLNEVVLTLSPLPVFAGWTSHTSGQV